jgi:hypothetical protein
MRGPDEDRAQVSQIHPQAHPAVQQRHEIDALLQEKELSTLRYVSRLLRRAKRLGLSMTQVADLLDV